MVKAKPPYATTQEHGEKTEQRNELDRGQNCDYRIKIATKNDPVQFIAGERNHDRVGEYADKEQLQMAEVYACSGVSIAWESSRTCRTRGWPI